MTTKHREKVGTQDKAKSAEDRGSYNAKPESFTGRAARALQGSVADKEVEKRASRKSMKRASLRGEK